MPLIKSTNTPIAIKPFSMTDIAKQAAGIMARAQQRAEGILIEAQRAGEDLRHRACAEGIVSGRKEGMARGLEEGRVLGREEALNEHREQLKAVLAALNVGVCELNDRRLALEAGVLHDVAELALKIAARITKRQGLLEPEVLEQNVRESLKLVIGNHKLRIALHPSQKGALADALPRLQQEFPTLEHVELIEDAAVEPGGCRLLTRQGQIDATLDEQLKRIAADSMPGA